MVCPVFAVLGKRAVHPRNPIRAFLGDSFISEHVLSCLSRIRFPTFVLSAGYVLGAVWELARYELENAASISHCTGDYGHAAWLLHPALG